MNAKHGGKVMASIRGAFDRKSTDPPFKAVPVDREALAKPQPLRPPLKTVSDNAHEVQITGEVGFWKAGRIR